MSEISDEKETVVTLLSNGSPDIFKDNSLTSFSNKLHTSINLNPANHNYVALASSSKSELVAPARGSFVGPSNLKSELEWNIEIT